LSNNFAAELLNDRLRQNKPRAKKSAGMSTIPSQARIRLIVKGRVQGVYFRASTVQRARQLALTGWVMNRYDGSVEMVAEGRPDSIEELIVWCGQGPPGARVNEVDLQRQDFRGEFCEFGIRQPLD
jgi:acylphosphatase